MLRVVPWFNVTSAPIPTLGTIVFGEVLLSSTVSPVYTPDALLAIIDLAPKSGNWNVPPLSAFSALSSFNTLSPFLNLELAPTPTISYKNTKSLP